MIEGIDGVGKTTTAKLLAEMIDAIYYKTPSYHFEKLRVVADRVFRNDPQRRFKFYFNSVKFASTEIRQIIQKKPLVCDRYIWSTVVYRKALGFDLSNFDIDGAGIAIPHMLFHCTPMKRCVEGGLGKETTNQLRIYIWNKTENYSKECIIFF